MEDTTRLLEEYEARARNIIRQQISLSEQSREIGEKLQKLYSQEKIIGPTGTRNYAELTTEPYRELVLVIRCPSRFPTLNQINKDNRMIVKSLRYWWAEQINAALNTLHHSARKQRFGKAGIFLLSGSKIDLDNYGIKAIVDAVTHELLVDDDPKHMPVIALKGNLDTGKRIYIWVTEQCKYLEDILDDYYEKSLKIVPPTF